MGMGSFLCHPVELQFNRCMDYTALTRNGPVFIIVEVHRYRFMTFTYREGLNLVEMG